MRATKDTNLRIRNAILGILTIAAFIGCGLMANAQELEAEPPPAPIAANASFIDYDAFTALANEVAPYRAQRLVSLIEFNEMKADPATIILDSRSPGSFAMGHVEGAVNVNFSDFTDDKLAKMIPSKNTRILIYCNNNFEDNIDPVMLKRIDLALNVPTFINLYGYGYTNVYELEGMHSISDPEIHWVGDQQMP